MRYIPKPRIAVFLIRFATQLQFGIISMADGLVNTFATLLQIFANPIKKHPLRMLLIFFAAVYTGSYYHRFAEINVDTVFVMHLFRGILKNFIFHMEYLAAL